MTDLVLRVERLPHGEDLPLPKYETAGAAGMDLYAAESLTLSKGEHALIATGLKVALPQGYEMQIRPRSGLAAKHGITVLNSPGTIDSDYRGEIKVILINRGTEDFAIAYGDRIAQMIVAPVSQAQWQEVNKLDKTKRGNGGFGSTGGSG